MASKEQKVAVVIPAKDEAERIAETVRAARSIPGVDLVVVVDDGSSDTTLNVARSAGATAVRHTVNRGKAAAMETGASVVAMRDVAGVPAHVLMFIDADLGESALETASLIPPVVSGETDCAIAALPPQEGAGGHGFVVGLGKSSIEKATGWKPLQPAKWLIEIVENYPRYSANWLLTGKGEMFINPPAHALIESRRSGR